MAFLEPIYRPPWEQDSVLIPATQGCNWNRCKFCYRPKDYPFKVATAEEFKHDLAVQLPEYPPDSKVFFVGSNTLVLPVDRLVEYLQIVDEVFPTHGDISMYGRIDAIAGKTDADLRLLKEKGLSHLYLGAENGNDEILEFMNKGHTSEQVVQQLKRLEAAGISYTVFYILGLGGKGKGETAARDTASVFNQLHPMRIATTGMRVSPNAEVEMMERNGTYTRASEREMIEELRLFLRCLNIQTLYDGIHELNPVHYSFDTAEPGAKESVIEDLTRILDSYPDESTLEAVMRNFMNGPTIIE